MNSTSSRPASGRQFELRRGEVTATIASVGASLRALTVGGRNLILPFAADEVRPGYRGATLAPWPNRVVDGHYEFQGETHQLALTEPARGQALHGLVIWLDFEVVEQSADHVTLRAIIEPQAGYPWRVAVKTTYRLTADGITQSVTGTNLSERTAPWGVGTHPYLVAGDEAVDEWQLSSPAGEILEVTPDRLSPRALVDISMHPELDFREAHEILDARFDHAFTSLLSSAESEARTRVEVRSPSGNGVAMEWDGATLPWLQIYSSDEPGSETNRRALAVEPMSCAPDAFNDASYPFDTNLLTLEPGASHTAEWTIHSLT